MRSTSTRLGFRSLTLTLLLLLGAAAAVPAADPFYEGMLAEGRDALARGELESALLELEIASFGLLEEPPLLADALTHLALAQAEAERVRDLDATLERLLEVEIRFGGYRQAEIPDATRQRLEAILAERISPSRLRRIETFRPLAQQRELESLMAMRPAERRAALEERLEQDPTDFRALQLLAELELEMGRPAAALGHFDRLIELGGEDPILVCRRFRAAARAGDCEVTVRDYSSCPEVARQPEIAAPVLECLAAAPDPGPALEFVAALPPEVRRASQIRRTERRLERLARQRSAAGEESATAEETRPASPSETPSEPPTAPSPTAPASDETEPPADRAAAAESADDPAASCDGFRRAALARRCAEALSMLDICRPAAEEPEVAERIAKCLAEADRWSDLASFVAALPPEVAGRPRLRRLARRAEKRAPEPPPSETPIEVEAEAEPGEETIGDDQPPAEQIDSLGRRLVEARSSEELDRVVLEVAELARRFPQSSEAQLLAAEAAYRAALWEEANRFFDAAGDPGDDRPLLLFYRAVSLYEVGRAREAAPYLERALPRLRKTPFVETYAERIRRAAHQ